MNDLNLVFLQDNCFNVSVGLFHVTKRLEDRRRGRGGSDLHDRNLVRCGGFSHLRRRRLGIYTRLLAGEFTAHRTDMFFRMYPHRCTDLRGQRALNPSRTESPAGMVGSHSR